jgi:hypothetical protein
MQFNNYGTSSMSTSVSFLSVSLLLLSAPMSVQWFQDHHQALEVTPNVTLASQSFERPVLSQDNSYRGSGRREEPPNCSTPCAYSPSAS